MTQPLEELVQYIRQTLPQPKALTNLTIDAQAGFVAFNWNSHKFVVKPTLEVLEIKGTRLFITGASMLMQTAFTRYDKDRKVLGAVNETLGQVEDFLSNHQTQKGLDLLDTVKKSITKLAGFSAPSRLLRSPAISPTLRRVPLPT